MPIGSPILLLQSSCPIEFKDVDTSAIILITTPKTGVKGQLTWSPVDELRWGWSKLPCFIKKLSVLFTRETLPYTSLASNKRVLRTRQIKGIVHAAFFYGGYFEKI